MGGSLTLKDSGIGTGPRVVKREVLSQVIAPAGRGCLLPSRVRVAFRSRGILPKLPAVG